MQIWGYISPCTHNDNHNSLIISVICKFGVKRRDAQESIFFIIKIIENFDEGLSLCQELAKSFTFLISLYFSHTNYSYSTLQIKTKQKLTEEAC